jgi:hypothetical protein
MDSALITLVRKSLQSATTEHDYTAGELFQRHEEIALVDPTGDACAVPSGLGEDLLDYTYDYASGATGRAVRGTRLSPQLNIDYIDNVVQRRLEQWKRERAVVYVSPNMGRNTVFSWRALDQKSSLLTGGGAAKDMTGNFTLTATFAAQLRYWDTARRQFIQKTSSNRTPLVATPGGAGLVAHPTVINRAKPTYPKSATLGSGATDSGWVKGGAGAADITAALVTNGFGHTECPHSLQVTVAANISADRYLAITDQLNPAAGNYAGYTFVNTAAATVVVWLRGQLPDSAALQFGPAGMVDIATRSLAGMRFDGWTPVSVSHAPTAWATNAPSVYLTLNSATGLGCSFEVGPVMIQQTASGYSSLPAAPVWSAEVTGGTSSGVAQVATSTAMTLPGQGTAVASFFVPADMGGTWRVGATFGLFSNSNLRVRAVITTSTEYITVSSVSPATSLSTAAVPRGTYLVPDRINTIAITWDGSSQKIYVNGQLAVTAVTAATTVPFPGSSSAMLVGKDGGGYCCAPLAMLTVRVDEGAMTATQIAQVHNALVDPVALGLAIACRGRTFRIVRIPATHRSSAGGSQHMGTIELEQVDFDQFTADPLLREQSIV